MAMSMEMMPRCTTCRPRETSNPGKSTQATIGQNITSHILFQRSRQSRDEHVDQLHVSVCSRQAARELRKFHDLGACRARHFLRDSAIVKRLYNDRLDVLS